MPKGVGRVPYSLLEKHHELDDVLPELAQSVAAGVRDLIASLGEALDQPGIVQVLYRVPDELASYAKLPYRLWVNHSRGEYVNWLAHTNGVESFWALVVEAAASSIIVICCRTSVDDRLPVSLPAAQDLVGTQVYKSGARRFGYAVAQGDPARSIREEGLMGAAKRRALVARMEPYGLTRSPRRSKVRQRTAPCCGAPSLRQSVCGARPSGRMPGGERVSVSGRIAIRTARGRICAQGCDQPVRSSVRRRCHSASSTTSKRMALPRIAGTNSAQSRRVACWEQMSNTDRLYSVSDASLRWRPLVSTTNTLWNGSAASGSSGFSVNMKST